MKTRLWKEFRLLAPCAAGTIALTVAFRPLVIGAGVVVPAACLQYACFVLMGTLLFGAEFSCGAMERLLAQPAPRGRIWVEKMAVLLSMVGAILLADLIVYLPLFQKAVAGANTARIETGTRLLFHTFASQLHTAWDITWIGALLAVGFGPLMALWLRQTHTAFWAAIVTPVALAIVGIMVDGFVVQHLIGFCISDRIPELVGDTNALFLVFGSWSVIAAWLSWRRFRKLEV